MRATEVNSAVEVHLVSILDHKEFADEVWPAGPIHRFIPGWRVRRFAPSRDTEPWVYVTIGAWEAIEDDKHPFELIVQWPTQAHEPVELLAMITHLHADPRYPLSVGKTLNVGRPLVKGSALDHVLISLPYPYGPTFEHLVVADKHIRFLWLMPITKAEAAYAHSNGVEALEQLLEQNAVDVLDLRRSSVVD